MSSKYLSARKLRITTAEHRALVRLADTIGASPFVADRAVHEFDEPEVPVAGIGFNMGFTAHAYDCGTVLCVGGHVSMIIQGVDMDAEHPLITPEQRQIADKYVSTKEDHGSLSCLYYPSIFIMDDARPGDAVHAIRNFLTTGDPEWREVINARLGIVPTDDVVF